MALNTPLSTGTPNLLTMLKAALGDNLTIGTAMDATYKQRLSDKQQWLAGEYDFPFLTKDWNVSIGAQSRFNNFPVAAGTVDGATKTLDWGRPYTATVLYSNRWMTMKEGIDIREYNTLSSDTISNGISQQVPEYLDPIQRWRPVSSTVFEVWPVPASTQTMRFRGQAVLSALLQPTDTADLDDELIVYSLAVDILAKRKDASSQALLSVAANRLSNLRSIYPTRDEQVVIGGSMDLPEKRIVPIIAVH